MWIFNRDPSCHDGVTRGDLPPTLRYSRQSGLSTFRAIIGRGLSKLRWVGAWSAVRVSPAHAARVAFGSAWRLFACHLYILDRRQSALSVL
jgi:hypothetical protein